MDNISVDHVPRYTIRWLRPAYSTALLDLPSAPVTQGATDAWRAFSVEESEACEAAWQRLPKDERRNSGEGVPADAQDDSIEQADVVGVQIYKDKLYEVDVRAMHLKPVYWRLTGSPIPVMRAHWMYDETHPVPEPLNSQLEAAYRKAKPWLASYAEELRAALSAGTSDAHDKLKRELPGNDQGQSIVFQDGASGRIVSDNLAFRVQQSLYSSFMSTNYPVAFPGATPVYRGFDIAQAAGSTREKPKVESSSPPSTNGSRVLGARSPAKHKSSASLEERELVATDVPSKTGEETDGVEITDLVFIVHGIGQNLATQYENLNFVYASNLFRQVCRKQSATPAISSIMRNRRVQFLPVMWRPNFAMTVEDASLREEDGLDNRFTVEDITLKDSIPFVRDLANNVLLDIPYFMSGHRELMIKAVCTEANSIYRKWCKRNPGFDTRGRVHIIGHSLGSPLVTHVLSAQPTHVTPLSQRSEEDIENAKGFLFDTSSLFMAGSPLAILMYLEQRQLIARKDRARTRNSPHDEALDRVNLFGCLSVDAIYNVFYPSDPVAYRLNPCVDSKLATQLPPSAISSINASFVGRLSKLLTLPTLPAMPAMPTMPTMPAFSSIKLPFMNLAQSRPSTPENKQNDDKDREGETQEKKRKEEEEKVAQARAAAAVDAQEDPRTSRARRRFEALNPHGTLDFYLPSEGAFSQYIDMVMAHANYWSDPAFGAFVLAEIFAEHEDRVRTGVGVDEPRR